MKLVNLDFASLYPKTFTMTYTLFRKRWIRRDKIKKIFDL